MSMPAKAEIAMRLAAFRRATGLTQAAFADAVGVPVGTLRNYEQGLSDIPAPFYFRLWSEFEVSLVWLGTGYGEAKSGLAGLTDQDEDRLAFDIAYDLSEHQADPTSVPAKETIDLVKRSIRRARSRRQ